jgi:hypothetical protein
MLIHNSPVRSAAPPSLKCHLDLKTIEDLIGIVCSGCGATITEEDIKAQVLKIAEREMRKVFGEHQTIRITI